MDATHFEPWNVVNMDTPGFGSIMSETGFLQLGVFNGGSSTFVDTWAIYCRATLCNLPWGAHGEHEVFRRAFAPMHRQHEMALHIMNSMQGKAHGFWNHQIAGAGAAVQTFMDNPVGMGEPAPYSLEQPLPGGSYGLQQY